MWHGLRPIVQTEHALNSVHEVGRDFHRPCPAAVRTSRMLEAAEFDLECPCKGADWPRKNNGPARDAFLLYAKPVGRREGADSREIIGESAVRCRKFFACQMPPLPQRRSSQFFDARKISRNLRPSADDNGHVNYLVRIGRANPASAGERGSGAVAQFHFVTLCCHDVLRMCRRYGRIKKHNSAGYVTSPQ